MFAAYPAQVIFELVRRNLPANGAVEVVKLEVRGSIEVAQRKSRALGARLIDSEARQSVPKRVDHRRLDLCVVGHDEAAAVVQKRGVRRQARKLRGNQIRLDVAERAAEENGLRAAGGEIVV